jgi:secreted trypsin-like serine protease
MSAEQTNAEIARIALNADRNDLSDEDVLDQIKRLAARGESAGRAMSASTRPPERAAKGPRLRDDPRYLAGVRALARRTQNSARIVGGDKVIGREFDDCVAVGGDGDWGCTGTLIAPDVVLTAGHCVELHTRVFIGNDVADQGREIGIREHVRHRSFTKGLRNDLMLLFLDQPVSGVTPRQIAGAALVDKAVDARIVGFGTTDVEATIGYGVKRKADVPVVSRDCRGRVGGKSDAVTYGCYTGLELVAGKPLLNIDSCRGDSGGPLYMEDAQGRWLLAGVTSRGTDPGTENSGRLCGDGGMYVRVHEYRAWIVDEIKKRRTKAAATSKATKSVKRKAGAAKLTGPAKTETRKKTTKPPTGAKKSRKTL